MSLLKLLFGFLFLLLCIHSCKKQREDCISYQPGYVYERYIPDSVSIDSLVVIGVDWKKKIACQKFSYFNVDTTYKALDLTLQTMINNCDCDNDTSIHRHENYIFKPDTVGKYPISIGAYGGAHFVDTIIVY